MSAPVNFCFSPVFCLEKEEAPTFRSGAFAIYFRCLLARVRPRADNANKAKESKEAYEGADGRGGHCVVNTNVRPAPWVVADQQFPAPGFG